MSGKKKNNNFNRDYRDICYFINHVKDIDFRIQIAPSANGIPLAVCAIVE